MWWFFHLWCASSWTTQNSDQIHELILEDSRISAKSIAEQLDISRERVGSIVHEDLDGRKLSAKWVPKCLNVDQKRQRCQSSEQLLEFFRLNPNDFLSRLVTMDETWLYDYDPETKQQWMEWRHSGSPGPKQIPRAKIRWKSSRLEFFWDKDGILLIDYLPKGQTINAEYCSSLLVQLKAILKEKRHGKVTKGALFLHDNAPAHGALETQKKLTYLGFQCLDHPTLFSRSGPVGLPSVPWTEKTIETSPFFVQRGIHCCRGDLVGRTKFWLFLSGFQKLEQRSKKFVELRGEYVE